MPAPLALAPVGVQTIIHPDGELAVARAAAAVGVVMSVSTVSASTLEEIASASEASKWFQLYWPNDRELAAGLLSRAEQAGYRAVIATLDTFLPGWKPRDLQGAWQPFLEGIGIANYTSDPVFRPSGSPAGGGSEGGGGRIRGAVLKPSSRVGGPRVPALEDHAADRAQGHPAPR